MHITDIKSSTANTLNIKDFVPQNAGNKAIEANTIHTNSQSIGINSWQKDILLNAIDMLDNSKQLDNSNPLDRIENSPIETFDEAKAELGYFNTQKFRDEASGAQANLKPQDILYLFTEDYAA
jgi:hypothetical protein